MMLAYWPTKLGDFVRANVGKYSSTTEHMGIILHIGSRENSQETLIFCGKNPGLPQTVPPMKFEWENGMDNGILIYDGMMIGW